MSSKNHKILQGIKTVAQDENRKSYLKIGLDCFSLFIKQKELPIHYFTCLLYKKGNNNLDDYISNRKMRDIRNNIYKKTLHKYLILEDKISFEEKLKENNIRTTNTIFYTRGNKFIINNETNRFINKEEFFHFFQGIFKSEKYNSLFLKPINGVGGKHSFKINQEDIFHQEKLDFIYKSFKEHDFLVQEIITQHERISFMYPKSINTIRIHTYIDGNQRKIASALMRFGKEKRVIDNGGIYVPINTETWSLESEAREFFEYGARTFKTHPDTKISFNNFRLPFPSDIKAQVLAAAKLFDAPLIGWDIALTPEGPLIIEANHNPHIAMAQQACNGFQNNEHFKIIFQDYMN